MKSVIFSIIAILIVSSVSAGDYETAMKSNISEMYQSHSPEKLEAIANRFFRIGEAEQDKWLPFYYAAYAYVSITFDLDEADQIDKYLDQAQEMLDIAREKQPRESEVYVLQGLLYSMRITGPARGMKYSSLSNEALGKAEKIDATNPRLWFCKAQNVHHTPSMFGGGARRALSLYEKAAELFESFQAPNPLWPSWGKRVNESQINKIIK